ncbi:YsnF/AvaK domain-containing protein [Janibacter limosus]|uniref:YsnF/AvaK domain-containing protein n=1 Tax=Janibacter limosus TaxID=53458 RepID=UPI0035D604B7
MPYTKDKVKGAPRVEDSRGHPEPAEEDELYAYYGVGGFEDAEQGREQGRGRDPKDEGRNTRDDDTLGPDADASMTRSEEQLKVGTTTETAGKARLRKFIVTENVTKTVPVSHEEVRIEREPITEGDRGDATVGRDLSEEEQEVELKAERVVVDKEAVPVERVKLGTETVTENETVDEQVRREQIEATDGTDPDEHTRDARR